MVKYLKLLKHLFWVHFMFWHYPIRLNNLAQDLNSLPQRITANVGFQFLFLSVMADIIDM